MIEISPIYLVYVLVEGKYTKVPFTNLRTVYLSRFALGTLVVLLHRKNINQISDHSIGKASERRDHSRLGVNCCAFVYRRRAARLSAYMLKLLRPLIQINGASIRFQGQGCIWRTAYVAVDRAASTLLLCIHAWEIGIE